MITADDIIDMCDLDRDQIAAIAAHEHQPAMTSALLSEYMLHLPHGATRVQEMICDDIRGALHADDLVHAKELYATLHRFMSTHPDAARGAST